MESYFKKIIGCEYTKKSPIMIIPNGRSKKTWHIKWWISKPSKYYKNYFKHKRL